MSARPPKERRRGEQFCACTHEKWRHRKLSGICLEAFCPCGGPRYPRRREEDRS